ncbi:MAG: LysM domain-containing protein [Phycisphaeraceae bacterium]
MQKLLSASAALMLMAGLAGCQSGEREELTEVPPPMYDEADSFEPVAVDEDENTEPVAVDDEPSADEQNGSAQAEPPRASGNGDADGTTYTVRRGDTLWSIAHRHYGDGQRWRDIADANPGISAERLPVGAEITLP